MEIKIKRCRKGVAGPFFNYPACDTSRLLCSLVARGRGKSSLTLRDWQLELLAEAGWIIIEEEEC